MAGGMTWNFQAVIDYYRTDADLHDDITVAGFTELLSGAHTWSVLIKKALEYQGFDPMVIVRAMSQAGKAYKAAKRPLQQWDLSNVAGDLAWTADSEYDNKYSNEETFLKDVQFLITMFLTRNNHFDKVTRKSRGGVGAILDMLKAKYNIDDGQHGPGVALDSATITLPRITGCFPTVACRMFHDGVAKQIVPFSSLPHIPESVNLSKALVCPFMASCVPKSIIEKDQQNIHPVLILVAIRLDDVIHKKEQNFTHIRDIVTPTTGLHTTLQLSLMQPGWLSAPL